MSLILRAHVAAAAQSVVPSWPLESFIAVNPLASHESEKFESAASSTVTVTREHSAYLSDFRAGRITELDLEKALLERTPALEGMVQVGDSSLPAVQVAIVDMTTAEWECADQAEPRMLWLDTYLSTWVASYLDPEPLWPMPHKSEGFYQAWKTLSRRDPSLPRSARRLVRAAPSQPEAALSWAFEQLSIPSDDAREAVTHELTHLPGWVAHIKWRAEHAGDIDLFSYLAVRFVLRAVLAIPTSPAAIRPPRDERPALWQQAERVANVLTAAPASSEDVAAVARVLASHPLTDHPFTWQKAYELHYQSSLLTKLSPRPNSAAAEPAAASQFQLVMCIDPRSEGMRRHMEETAAVETFGFAGFFGVPVRFARYNARGAVNSLPALLKPRHYLTEQPVTAVAGQQHSAAARYRDALHQAVHVADSSPATPFAFAETTGWIYGANSVIRTVAPGTHARMNRALTGSSKKLSSTVTIADAFTLEERVAMAETAVRMMGMSQLAPLVILAGHSSESTNNLYESALECGACGGNPGAANARAAAAIFNDPDVRRLLDGRGISIPATSFFVAADHNTVTDAVTLLDRHLIPSSHSESAAEFDRMQHTAATALLTERAADLPGASARQGTSRLRSRANDWAEVYPELGLAGNAAMIIGPRRMTRGANLARRVFLHSYETALDPDGTALETIMTAPLVVAQWINHQYYFSALNPTTLGAGTKTIHNAIGTIGVLAGHTGDLRRGLPWQSVGFGAELFHEPMRLSVVIEAPLARIADIVSRNQVLRNLLDNDWITLTARSGPEDHWHHYTQYGWKTLATMKDGAHA
jgi:uncharacterized protein YbcC (UPF0753/DUF2309 family)